MTKNFDRSFLFSLVLAILFANTCFSHGALSAAETPSANRDVFLLLGQSNMAGRGVLTTSNRISASRVLKLNQRGRWVSATEPIHYDKKVAGAGLAASFARVVADNCPDREICLVPCALGGSALAEWMPGAHLYTNAICRARIALASGKIRAILWHQGETDATSAEKRATYAKHLSVIVASLRADLGLTEVPFIYGEIIEEQRASHFKAHTEFNAMLPSVTNLVPNAHLVKAADLKAKPDLIHFDTQSLRILGRRYADAYLRIRSGM